MSVEFLSPSSLRISRYYEVDTAVLFDAWTNPDVLVKWFAAGPDYMGDIAEVDLRVGGKYRLGMRQIDEDLLRVAYGQFKEIIPNSKLVFTWDWEHLDPINTTVTLEFMPEGEGTMLVLTHDGFPDEELRDKHAEGWPECMEGLARL